MTTFDLLKVTVDVPMNGELSVALCPRCYRSLFLPLVAAADDLTVTVVSSTLQ